MTAIRSRRLLKERRQSNPAEEAYLSRPTRDAENAHLEIILSLQTTGNCSFVTEEFLRRSSSLLPDEN